MVSAGGTRRAICPRILFSEYVFENRNFISFQKNLLKWHPTNLSAPYVNRVALSADGHTQPKSTSITKEYFKCGRFCFDDGFVNKKHAQKAPRHMKSRRPWDGFYLRTSIMFRTGGKPSTWFPPVGLVELHVLRLFLNIFRTSLLVLSKKLTKIPPAWP